MQRVAIVEDDENCRFLLQSALTEEGYQAILIEGPGNLLTQVGTAQPDLVLLDFVLGAWGDCLALSTAIRRHPQLSQVPLIVMSAAPDVLQRHAGALLDLRCRIVEKPFDLDDLLALIAGELATAQC